MLDYDGALENVMATIAVGETSGILLHPPLPLAGVSMVMKRGCQHNHSIADGQVPGRPLVMKFFIPVCFPPGLKLNI